MIPGRLGAVAILAVLVAGCTSVSETDAPGPDAPDARGPDFRIDTLQFADAAGQTVEIFEGRFDFADNDQFAGEAHRAAGVDPDNVRVHALTELLPRSGVFRIDVVVAADPAGGDIDAWFMDDGTIGHWRCECPFGGNTHAIAYAEGDGGKVELAVRYDEVSSGPTDPAVAHQGFDYAATVTVTTMPDAVPPGKPVAFLLESPGDHLAVANHTQPITIYGPDDAQVTVLQPADTLFELDEGMEPGEYVLIGRLDSEPFEAKVGHSSPGPRTGRILDITYASGSASFDVGEEPRMTFEAPPTVIEVGGCGSAGDATVDPSFRMLDPADAVWVEDAPGGPALLGWSVCYSNWPGSPDQRPGTWTLEFTETAGQGAELMWWTSAYER